VEVLPSALKHGVDPEDALHAVQLALVVDEIGDDPLRYLLIGPDRAGNLLELVVLDRRNGPAVIHAMRLRPQYRRLLPREP
jgi:glucose dehydrogenase